MVIGLGLSPEFVCLGQPRTDQYVIMQQIGKLGVEIDLPHFSFWSHRPSAPAGDNPEFYYEVLRITQTAQKCCPRLLPSAPKISHMICTQMNPEIYVACLSLIRVHTYMSIQLRALVFQKTYLVINLCNLWFISAV